jgi:hypothetical protein
MLLRFIVGLCLWGGTAVLGQDPLPAAKEPAAKEPAAPRLQTVQDKASYGFGYQIGRQFRGCKSPSSRCCGDCRMDWAGGSPR